eukprot:gene13729-19627_t
MLQAGLHSALKHKPLTENSARRPLPDLSHAHVHTGHNWSNVEPAAALQSILVTALKAAAASVSILSLSEARSSPSGPCLVTALKARSRSFRSILVTALKARSSSFRSILAAALKARSRSFRSILVTALKPEQILHSLLGKPAAAPSGPFYTALKAAAASFSAFRSNSSSCAKAAAILQVHSVTALKAPSSSSGPSSHCSKPRRSFMSHSSTGSESPQQLPVQYTRSIVRHPPPPDSLYASSSCNLDAFTQILKQQHSQLESHGSYDVVYGGMARAGTWDPALCLPASQQLPLPQLRQHSSAPSPLLLQAIKEARQAHLASLAGSGAAAPSVAAPPAAEAEATHGAVVETAGIKEEPK